MQHQTNTLQHQINSEHYSKDSHQAFRHGSSATYCNILHHCNTLHQTLRHRTTLPHCNTLHRCTTLHQCNTLHHCNTLYHCNTLHHCSTSHHHNTLRNLGRCLWRLRRVRGNYTRTQCCTLQHVPVKCPLRYPTTHYNTMGHPATHCNMLLLLSRDPVKCQWHLRCATTRCNTL